MADTVALRLDKVSIGTLDGVSFTIAPGEIVCLSGPSGSGKSRLLRAIADLEPHGGDIWLGERAQSQFPGHEWRRQVMLVPAESQWWAPSVGEHFQHSPVEDLSTLGFETKTLDWQIGRLSSGEKQRLALLRALSRSPRALLLDEPTANLDDTTIHRCESWLRERTRQLGLPVLWVAHDSRQIERVANRHYRIEGSRLKEVS
ncbi:ABC transporter ATP-binding protein [Litchfieldella qijiaojingensis]|uniref:ABC transporter ATP-binding protein n=1 Tax=Litchfieldella qijiaojingensis TaxID=980347 RepID=A0ABQ2Z6I5_9GAMM|nr:ABC transporter ATP-binding protein [Halomonas qijiaojingensis]GGY05006.1 ABC transporter ATP-binding protein [Halomonas qijiaojingensis]